MRLLFPHADGGGGEGERENLILVLSKYSTRLCGSNTFLEAKDGEL